MPDELRLFLKERFGVQGPLSPGRFEAELAKRLGSPARRAPTPLKCPNLATRATTLNIELPLIIRLHVVKRTHNL